MRWSALTGRKRAAPATGNTTMRTWSATSVAQPWAASSRSGHPLTRPNRTDTVHDGATPEEYGAGRIELDNLGRPK
jgi:hypothetical protein